MSIIQPHKYDTLSAGEAVALQKQMREKIDIQALAKEIHLIAGADISFNKFEETVYAGIVVLKYPELTLVEKATVITKTKFPYIPGLLAFREVPALLLAWEKLSKVPDVLMLDGHGIAHKRRLGIATHFGLLTDIPTLGCAKNKLTGTYVEPGNIPFAKTGLFDKEEQIGTVLRSKKNCKPLFISPGHKIGLEQSVKITENCITTYRLPAPTRLAHLLVNEVRLENKANHII